jgi:heavy metal translocating P-type ATPase
MTAEQAAAAEVRAAGCCVQCGFPVRVRARRGAPASAVADPGAGGAQFCCYGCALVNQIAGARGERSEPTFILARLGLAAFLSMNVMMLGMVLYAGDPLGGGPLPADPFAAGMAGLFRHALLLFSLPVLLLLGWPIAEGAWRRFRSRGAGVDALIALGAFAAFGVSALATLRGQGAVYYETACMTLVLVTLGRYLEARARAAAAASMGALLSGGPEIACVLRDGVACDLPIAEVRVSDLVRIAPGGRVPVDGEVVDGEGFVDESSLTGEPVPRKKASGSPVLAGTTSVDGAFLVRATAVGADRTSARVARLLERARAARAPIERLADRVSAVFTPAACAAALGTALYWGVRLDAGTGIERGLSVLLIACPCALGLATPLAVWEAIGAAARRGIVLRGGEVIERLAAVRSIFFDKTGTLTERQPRLVRVRPAGGFTEDEVLALAASLEAVSRHPMALAVVRAARERGLLPGEARRFRLVPGTGVEGEVALGDGAPRRVSVGGAVTSVVVDGRPAGTLEFEEGLRPGAPAALGALRERGIEVAILTGDRSASARDVAHRLGVPARTGLLPAGKVRAIAASERLSGPAGMVGDGVNDAPALARAGVSFALGCGDDLAQEAADVRLLRDDLQQIPWLVDLARRTVRVIRRNLFWAFAYNVVLVPLAITGRLQPVLAALAMIASSLFVVGNSVRLRRGPEEDARAWPDGLAAGRRAAAAEAR